MTSESRATAALHDAVDATAADVYKATADITTPMAAMMGATDIVSAIRASGNLILAFEAIEEAASEATKRLRAAVAEAMNDNGVPTIATEQHLISCYDPAPRAQIIDPDSVPRQFWVQPPEKIDVAALAKALRAGRVPGAVLTNGGAPILRISTRKDKQ